MTDNDVEFNLNIIKNLTDKNQDKRQSACKQLEIIVRRNADKKNYNQIDKIITFFKEKYIKSNDMIKKRAGIQSLPSIVSGYKNYSDCINKFTQTIIKILLSSLNDNEPKIRYMILKSLFYISKSLDQKIVKYFNQIFEEIIGKINDLQQQVKQAASFLDKSLQTILHSALSSSSSETIYQDFNLKQFMWIVKIKIKSQNPSVREFLIKWITNLNEVITVDLLAYLPEILEDLLFMLGDKEKNLRKSTEECLNNFEREMNQKFIQGKLEQYMSEDTINKIISILIKVAKGKSSSFTKLSTLIWFKLLFSFFKAQVQSKPLSQSTSLTNLNSLNKKPSISPSKFLFKKIILQKFDQVLEAILLLMSHEEQQVRKASLASNQLLMQNIQKINKEQTINFSKVMPLLKEMLSQKKSTSTSQSALRWMKFMLQNYNDKILPEIQDIIQKLAQKLCQSNTKNVIQIIQNTTVRQQYFQLFIQKMLVLLLQKSPSDSQIRSQMILKKFCNILEADKFCKTICYRITQKLEDKKFIFEIVQNLNNLIITEKNMLRMRKKLQNKYEEDHKEFFMILFNAFRYNPAAVTSLCFLAQQYKLAYNILNTFGLEFQISQTVLLGFCKLASMIESPGFLFLRLQILEKQKHPFLIESLSALLMLLPQGKIFNMLKNRLQLSKVIMPRNTLQYKQESPQKMTKLNQKTSQINIDQCMKDYMQVQQMFQQHKQK